ncbi:DUF7547 family protein [Halobellus sp. GM3]|uniref:DUF7547 family protein n=1 Tax=Halobellus sp. GM3 TaxID=3458410 RepID=UPI00403DD4F3
MSPANADDDFHALLDDLETTLSALREELRDGGADGSGETDGPGTAGTAASPPDSRGGPPRRPGRAGGRPRPPSISELFRFTEEYTLPTLIAMLEATIQSLELLRGVLRLASPERSAFGSGADRRAGGPTGRSVSTAARLGDGVAGVGREAASGVERALSELQTALSESDIPEDRTSRELLDDARRLSEEVAERLAEARREGEADRYGYRRDERRSGGGDADSSATARVTGGVDIDVDDERGGDESGGDQRREGGDGSDPDEPEVDVESELASIKDEVGRRGERAVGGDGDGDHCGESGRAEKDGADADDDSDRPEDSDRRGDK